MSEATELTPEAFNAGLAQMIPRAHEMGVEVTQLRPGHVEARVPIEGNTNHIGTMYAGVLFAVAEILGGAIVVSSFDVSKVYPVVRDLKITFRKPVRGPVTSKASLTEAQIAELGAEAEANGKAQFVFTAEIFDEAGELVAETEATYQIRAHGS